MTERASIRDPVPAPSAGNGGASAPAGLPVVGVICCNRTVGSEKAQAVMDRYVRAVIRHTPAAALLVPSMPDVQSVDAVIDRLDGLVLTGSPSNVAPACYGDAAPGAGPFDPARDATMLALVEAAGRRGVPMLGICRGFQELNAALGGTLRGDLSAPGRSLAHHAPDGVPFDAMFAHAHCVMLEPGGPLSIAIEAAGVTGGTMTVNSVHYQGIDRPAPGIRIEAVAPDGVVEAFTARHGLADIIAVQWHPEWGADDDPASRAVFGLFGRMIARAGGIAANGLAAAWPAPDPAPRPAPGRAAGRPAPTAA